MSEAPHKAQRTAPSSAAGRPSQPTPTPSAASRPTEPMEPVTVDQEDTETDPIVVKDRRGQHRERNCEPPETNEGPAAPPAASAARIAELEQQLAERDTRLEATLAQYKDALDEFARVKARLTRDVAKEVQAGKRSFLTQLLDVLDNLERALDAATSDPAQATSPLCEGITMVRDQFHAKLAALGVRKVPALHQPFDPLHFEALSTVPTSDAALDGCVVGVMRDAYLLDDETLRHGMVAVGKHDAQA